MIENRGLWKVFITNVSVSTWYSLCYLALTCTPSLFNFSLPFCYLLVFLPSKFPSAPHTVQTYVNTLTHAVSLSVQWLMSVPYQTIEKEGAGQRDRDPYCVESHINMATQWMSGLPPHGAIPPNDELSPPWAHSTVKHKQTSFISNVYRTMKSKCLFSHFVLLKKDCINILKTSPSEWCGIPGMFSDMLHRTTKILTTIKFGLIHFYEARVCVLNFVATGPFLIPFAQNVVHMKKKFTYWTPLELIFYHWLQAKPHHSTTVTDLSDALLSEWEQVSTAPMFQHLAENLPRGIEAVIAKGTD